MKFASCLVALLVVGCQTSSSGSDSGAEDRPPASVDGRAWVRHAFPTGRESDSAVLLERGTPTQVPVGQPYEYELRVTNISAHPLEDVVVVERNGGTVTLVSAEPAAAVDGEVSRWSLGTLEPGVQRTIKVTVTPRNTGALESRCEVEYRQSLHGTTEVYEPKLALAGKVLGGSLVGEPVVYRITLSNPGSGPARDIVVTSTLPDGLEAADGKQEFRAEVAVLDARTSREFEVALRGGRIGDFSLTASAVASGDLSTAAVEVPLLVRVARLEVEVLGPRDWVLNRDARYVLVVRNAGEGTARNAALKLTLPDGITFARSSVKPSGELTWEFGELAAGAEQRIEVFVRPSVAGELDCKVDLVAPFCESAAAAWKTKVIGVAALALEVSDGLDPVGVGGEVTYRVVVRNQGSAPGVSIKVICLLEETMQFVSADGSSKGSLDGGRVVFEPLATLAVGASAEWTIVVRSIGAGDARFKVLLSSAEMSRPVEAAESTRFYGAK